VSFRFQTDEAFPSSAVAAGNGITQHTVRAHNGFFRFAPSGMILSLYQVAIQDRIPEAFDVLALTRKGLMDV